MLAQFPAEVVNERLGRSDICADGIAAARRAMAVYEQEAKALPDTDADETAQDQVTARQQVGRVHHLVGDLLRSSGEPSRIREALAEFEEALACRLPEKIAIAVRQSRGEAIAALDDASEEELRQAEKDLIESISADAERLARSFQWMRFLQLATVASKLDRPDRELAALEQGASLALEQIRHNPEEWIFQQRSERMVGLFNALASAYVRADRPIDALAAAEALRAATVRFHTQPEASANLKTRTALDPARA